MCYFNVLFYDIEHMTDLFLLTAFAKMLIMLKKLKILKSKKKKTFSLTF